MKRFEEQWQKPEAIKAKLQRIAILLEEKYGLPERRTKSFPLSQNTNDLNRDRAYQKLRRRFPRWSDLLRANTRSIASAIQTGGLARQKAKRIKAILRWIQARTGRLSLSFLKNMERDRIFEALGELKGIGPKTLHCLLLFGLGKEAFPVDTHILRIGKRVGFIPERLNADQAHPWMAPLIPEGKSFSLHLNLIHFGRSICKAKHPECSHCLLAEECLHHSKYRIIVTR